MFDILTVVFRDELSILRVQAQSIELFCQDLGIRNIFVIVNDDDSVVKDIDVNWYGSLSNLVKIVPRSQLGSYYHNDGWISQQYLKLKGSTLSKNKWVMVLDAKSIFVKKIYLKKFFDIFGRVKAGYWKLDPAWGEVEKNINKLFNIKIRGDTGCVPYLFKVDIVKNLISDLELKTAIPFDKWFQHFESCHITEIALYIGYVQSKYRSLWKYASKFRYIDLTCVGRNRIDKANSIFDNELFKTRNQRKNHVVMIHRYVWNILDSERKERYKNFLVSRGLTTARDLA